MPAKMILVVEDDKNISKLVRYNLEKEGYSCRVAPSGEEALDIMKKEKIDLVLLDIMLPGMDGLEVCRTLKQQQKTASIPVLMLTAKGEEVDRVVGFELGADDYVVKPFSTRELLLRIKAILKRGSGAPEKKAETLIAGDIVIDIPRHRVTAGKKDIDLTPMEFDLLVTLIERAGRVQSRERLLNDVWGIASDVTTRTVDTHIKRLREKLGKAGNMIDTVRGFGYRFKEEE
ncbi:MAG: response regulator [Candidatus Omnitrophica bacterium]|nr:response regulator [Candidatus Omnitrophota bacterium]